MNEPNLWRCAKIAEAYEWDGYDGYAVALQTDGEWDAFAFDRALTFGPTSDERVLILGSVMEKVAERATVRAAVLS